MSSDDRIIELLSLMLDEQKETNRRLGSVEGRLESVEHGLESVEQRLISVENEAKITNQRLGALEYAFLNDSRELRTRVERLEATVAKLSNAA